jgi:hypothetical protein
MGSYWLLGTRSWHAEQVAWNVVISLVIPGQYTVCWARLFVRTILLLATWRFLSMFLRVA